MKVLLDTHVLVWWTLEPERLSRKQASALAGLSPENPGYVADISLWEIATAYSLGRLELEMPLKDYLASAVASPLIHRVGISPAIAAEVAALPDSFHRDPGDRLIVASSRVLGATLLTNDGRILASKLVKTVA
jgi:PIN domain nuclease of toxin-antitoxin system